MLLWCRRLSAIWGYAGCVTKNRCGNLAGRRGEHIITNIWHLHLCRPMPIVMTWSRRRRRTAWGIHIPGRLKLHQWQRSFKHILALDVSVFSEKAERQQ